MPEPEYKRYDSNHELECRNVRLTHDAKQLGDTVKVTFVLTSRLDKDSDMWIEAIPSPAAAELARNLKKGDVLSATGFLTMQKWGDNDDKLSFTLRFAKLHYPLDLLHTLKERQVAEKPVRKPAARPQRAVDPTEDIPF